MSRSTYCRIAPAHLPCPTLSKVDLRHWFADEELGACPSCGRCTALRAPRGGFFVCLECGLLTLEGQRVGDLKTAAARLLEPGAEAPA